MKHLAYSIRLPTVFYWVETINPFLNLFSWVNSKITSLKKAKTMRINFERKSKLRKSFNVTVPNQ